MDGQLMAHEQRRPPQQFLGREGDLIGGVHTGGLAFDGRDDVGHVRTRILAAVNPVRHFLSDLLVIGRGDLRIAEAALTFVDQIVHRVERSGNRHDRRFQVVRNAADHLT